MISALHVFNTLGGLIYTRCRIYILSMMRKTAKTTFIWIALFMGLYALATGKLHAQTKPYFFEHLTIREGLSHNTVHAVIQDRNGFMWFGTQNGLNKYDGYSFKTYSSDSKTDPAFEGRIVTALLEDREGNIWAGTQKKGINVLAIQTGRFWNLRHKALFKDLSEAWIYSLFQDRSGNIWIGTLGNGAYVYNPSAQTLQHFQVQNQKINNDSIFDFAQDENGTIWAVTGQIGLSRYNVSQQRFEQVLFAQPNQEEISGFRKNIFADQMGYLWIGTEKQGLFRYNLYDRSFQTYTVTNSALSAVNIRDVELDPEKNILIATDGGGFDVLDRKTQVIRSVQHNPVEQGSINTNALYDIFVAKDGNIWLGTFNGGVNVHKAQKMRFESYSHTGYISNEISHSSVLSLLETRDGKIWVGTDGGGLNLFNPSAKTFSSFQNQPQQSSSIGGNIVKALYEDAKGRIWIGFYEKGLDCYDPATGSFKHYPYGSDNNTTLSISNVWSITGNTDGTLWIGTLGGGLNHFNPETGVFTHYRHDPKNPASLSSDDVMLVYRDLKNRLWVGTQDKGLDLFDPSTGRFTHYRHNPNMPNSMSSNEIRAIFEDYRGLLWIGTEDGGLNLALGNGIFKHYTTKEGFISNNVMGIAEDHQHKLWVTSSMGLSKFDPMKNVVENFNFHNMSQANQFNQAAILYTQSGNLMVGGINNLNVLNVEQASYYKNILNPKIFITDLKVFNNSILAGEQKDHRIIYSGLIENAKTIFLSYLDNAFSFDFTSLDYNEPNNNRFLYKLEGFHQDWQTLSLPQHTASFTNLEPATYTLRVRGTNSIGQWSSNEIALQVVISPPFWKTIWFRLLILLLVVMAVFAAAKLFIQRRERHLKEKMLESEREILQLRNEKLASELESKNTQLVSLGLQMAHKNDFLNKVKTELHAPALKEALKQDADAPVVHRVINMIDSEVRGEDFWERFNAYFNEINNNFTRNITLKHPDLSPNDIRLCSLIMINLNTKEMASILNITPKGVEKSRYRLKKKLGLALEDDLGIYLKSFT
jgi:ligand-binding sensor domain-containing protein/DNA-binding CsgD family transcriptional regulator